MGAEKDNFDYLWEDGFIFPKIDKRIAIYRKGIDPYGVYTEWPREKFELRTMFATVVRIKRDGKWYDVVVKEFYKEVNDSGEFHKSIAVFMERFIEKVYSTMLLFTPTLNVPSENQISEEQRIGEKIRFEA